MKSLLLLFTLVVSSFCLAQNTGAITGVVLDGESFNEPLVFANVSIAGTNLKSSSDSDGLFHFDNLADGKYILLVSFNGYETKQLNVQVVSNKDTNISASLVARTLSLSALSSSAEASANKDKASITFGN